MTKRSPTHIPARRSKLSVWSEAPGWARSAGAAAFAACAFGVSVLACGQSSPTTAPSGSALASAVNLSAPPAGAPPAGVREGSTVALSEEGDAVFVVDEDHSALDVIALPITFESKAIRVETPGRPAQITVVGKKILVSIREMPDGSGALLSYERKPGGDIAALSETARATLPPDAWGIAVSPDASLAAVTSAWTAKVSLVDIPSMKVGWTREVAREPRGAIFLADGNSVYVSHLIDAPITRIDDVRGAAKVTRVPFPASPMRSPVGENLSASNGYALAMTPDRSRLFAPRHALGTLGSSAWFGSATVDVLDVATEKPLGIHREMTEPATFLARFDPAKNGNSLNWSAAADFVIPSGATVFSTPRAAVYRKSQNTLLVAGEADSSVVELDGLMSDPTLATIRRYGLTADSGIHGGAPSGIALSNDESMAFVQCRSTDELAVIHLFDWEGGVASAPPLFVKLADDPPDHTYMEGRRLFYSGGGTVSCSGCHPEGRDDGYVWHEVHFDTVQPGTTMNEHDGFANFIGSASQAKSLIAFWKTDIPIASNVEPSGAGFARQTPMLVGRLKAKGPYGWRAESADLEGRLLAGFALHRWRSDGDPSKDPNEIAMARMLIPFIQTGLVPPPVEKRPLTEEEQRGKDIFTSDKAQCSTCHAPETDYTNHAIAALPDAGPRQAFVSEKNAAYKVPSLLFVGGSPPYFHDGRYATLEELIDKNGDRMGKTSHLDEAGKKALVAFLKTL